MSGVEISWQRLTKVALIEAHSQLNRWNIDSTSVLSLNKGGDMPPTSCGNSLPKEGISARKTHFLWWNASSINLCARYLNGSVAFGSSWGVVFHGLSSANKMILCLMINNGPFRKHVKSFGTPCKIMVGSSRNILSHIWKRPWTWRIKLFFNEFDSTWGVKSLILIWSNLMAMWKIKPQMRIIYWFPLGLH